MLHVLLLFLSISLQQDEASVGLLCRAVVVGGAVCVWAEVTHP